MSKSFASIDEGLRRFLDGNGDRGRGVERSDADSSSFRRTIGRSVGDIDGLCASGCRREPG